MANDHQINYDMTCSSGELNHRRRFFGESHSFFKVFKAQTVSFVVLVETNIGGHEYDDCTKHDLRIVCDDMKDLHARLERHFDRYGGRRHDEREE